MLGAAGVPVGPVNDLPAAFADPQTVARGDVVEVEHPRLGTVRHIASPLRLDGERAADPQRPGARRAHARGPARRLRLLRRAARGAQAVRSRVSVAAMTASSHDMPVLLNRRGPAGIGGAVDELRERDQLVLAAARRRRSR